MITVLLLSILVIFGAWTPSTKTAPYCAAQTPQTGRGGFTTREPNLYSPSLYADKIDFVATLVKLPGATNKQSYWELSYQLFFVPENTYYETIRHLPRGGSNPTPEQFPGRILLAKGHRTTAHLSTLQERTITLTGVRFKQKIPDAQRTKFSYLMTSYSVKIFDAELNTTAYHSGIFLAEPYETNANDQSQATARKTIYLNFGVNADGSLNRSQLPPKTSDARR